MIEFLVEEKMFGVVPEPHPASRVMPDWFRNLSSYPTDLPPDGFAVPTAKRCIPMQDMLSLGYIMPLPWAVRVVATEDGDVSFSWLGQPLLGEPIQKHTPSQVEGYPTDVPLFPFKFNNPWIVRTPPGWSTLFLPLPNRAEQRFETFSGMVDTDAYFNGINFPFIWKRYPYDGVLDAGTPIIQAVPVRRDELDSSTRAMEPNEEAEMHKFIANIQSHQHHYARNIRQSRKNTV